MCGAILDLNTPIYTIPSTCLPPWIWKSLLFCDCKKCNTEHVYMDLSYDSCWCLVWCHFERKKNVRKCYDVMGIKDICDWYQDATKITQLLVPRYKSSLKNFKLLLHVWVCLFFMFWINLSEKYGTIISEIDSDVILYNELSFRNWTFLRTHIKSIHKPLNDAYILSIDCFQYCICCNLSLKCKIIILLWFCIYQGTCCCLLMIDVWYYKKLGWCYNISLYFICMSAYFYCM